MVNVLSVISTLLRKIRFEYLGIISALIGVSIVIS